MPNHFHPLGVFGTKSRFDHSVRSIEQVSISPTVDCRQSAPALACPTGSEALRAEKDAGRADCPDCRPV